MSLSISASRTLREEAIYRALALLVIFVAFLVRLHRLDAMGLEGDEAFGIQAAFSGLSNIVQMASTAEPHPPLFYALLRAWYMLVGTGEFALRVPSVLANVLTVAFLFKTADLFHWRWAGLLAGLLLALNPYQVWYAQDIRMYTPVALLGLVAIYYALRALFQGKLPELSVYVVSILLAMYTHYYAIFLFVFINVLWAVWSLSPDKLRLPTGAWMAAQATVVVLFFPWLATAHQIALSYTRFARGTVDLLAIVKESLVRYSLGLSVPDDTGFSLSLGFAAIGAAGLWFACRGRHRLPIWLGVSFVFGYAFIPVVVGLLVSLLRPMFAARYLFVSGPAFYLILGLGVVALYRRLRILGVAAGLFLVAAQVFSLNNYFYDDAYVKTDFPNAVAYVQQHSRPGDAIVLDGWSQAFQFWYYYTLRAKEPVPSYLFPLAEANADQLTPRKLDEIMFRHQGVWLLDYDVLSFDPRRLVEAHLATSYYQALYQRVRLNRVVYYASAPSSPPIAMPLDITCDEQAVLREFTMDTTSARPGQILRLALRWQALRDVNRDYDVSWRLLDPSGRLVLQRDSGPASGFLRSGNWKPDEEVTDRYGMPIPTYVTPGQYSLAAVVYDKASGGACQAQPKDKVLPGGLIPLGRVDVLDERPLDPIDNLPPFEQARFAIGGLELLGLDLPVRAFRPGDAVTTKLFWQTTENIGQDFDIVVRLVDEQGQLVQEKVLGLGPPWFPTSRWSRGRTFVTYVDVPVPPRAATGNYGLSLLVKGGGLDVKAFASLPRLAVISRARSFEVPAIRHAATANFGGLVELLGYDAQPPVGAAIYAGQTLRLKLNWRALREMAESYKVFTHLVGEDGQIYGQSDSIPLAGNAPTNGWVPGEILEDSYEIVLRSSVPAGRYRLSIGFYNQETGSRIPLADGTGDSLMLATVEVATPGR